MELGVGWTPSTKRLTGRVKEPEENQKRTKWEPNEDQMGTQRKLNGDLMGTQWELNGNSNGNSNGNINQWHFYRTRWLILNSGARWTFPQHFELEGAELPFFDSATSKRKNGGIYTASIQHRNTTSWNTRIWELIVTVPPGFHLGSTWVPPELHLGSTWMKLMKTIQLVNNRMDLRWNYGIIPIISDKFIAQIHSNAHLYRCFKNLCLIHLLVAILDSVINDAEIELSRPSSNQRGSSIRITFELHSIDFPD